MLGLLVFLFLFLHWTCEVRLVPTGASQAVLNMLAINITRWMNSSTEQRWTGSGGLSLVTLLANFFMSRDLLQSQAPFPEGMDSTRLSIQTLNFCYFLSLWFMVEIITLTSVLNKILKQWDPVIDIVCLRLGMTHGLRVLATVAEDLSFVPSSWIVQFIHNLLWLWLQGSRHPLLTSMFIACPWCACRQAGIYIVTYINKNN